MLKKKPVGIGSGIKGLGQAPKIGTFAPRRGPVVIEKTNESGDDDVIAVKGGQVEEEDDESKGRYVNLEVHFKNSYKMITCGRRWTPEEIVRNVSKQLNVA